MGRIKLYQDENLLIEHISEGNYQHQTWWGVTPSIVFLRLLEYEIIKYLEQENADGLIIDAREHAGLGPQTQKKAAEMITQYAIKKGGFKEAIIIPEVLFSKFSVENYGAMFDATTPIETRYFKDLESAEEWLTV